MRVRHKYRGEGVVLGEVKIDGRKFLEVAFVRVDFDTRSKVETVLVREKDLEPFLDHDMPFKAPRDKHKYDQTAVSTGRKASNDRPDAS